jgi:tRNA pseudouridine38-40 synthase
MGKCKNPEQLIEGQFLSHRTGLSQHQENNHEVAIARRESTWLLEQQRAWVLDRPLNPQAMSSAAVHLVGTHDFSTFRNSRCQSTSPMRTMLAVEVTARPFEGSIAGLPRWAQTGAGLGCGDPWLGPGSSTPMQEIVVSLKANAFLYRQIRKTVAALVDVGLGEKQPQHFEKMLRARDSSLVWRVAPPQGLYLANVNYAHEDSTEGKLNKDINSERASRYSKNLLDE